MVYIFFLCRDGNIVAVDSVTPTLFVISEGGDLLRWWVFKIFLCSWAFFISAIMPFYFRFDCADYMREPSDIAVGGREFYVCDFKVMSLTIVQYSTSFLNFTMFFNDITLAGPQRCCFHRGRSLRKTNWVRIDSKMSASEKTLIPTIRSGKFLTYGSLGAKASPTSQTESTSPMLEIFLSAIRMGTGEQNRPKMITMGTGTR